ncbi:BON domain-containing protein [Lacipirellula limnantheis]|uniref:BON domain protein n=1 Tax=Lacipirellula limnantheis TaxID=2528024 RepID=A0A517TWB4_9BACT|nr:BON domain-containing protein [Lacipirellula limnantheis]QDT72657.1 BON domain protein [Lacipirellula limnantheis]
MQRSLQFAAVVLAVGVLASATNVDQAAAQGARNSLNQSQSGSLRNSYAGGISSGRATASNGARGGAFGGGQARGGLGVNGAADANGASGQGGVGQGPMAAGLAQTAGERFQQGGFVGRDADDVRNSFESQNARRGTGGMLDAMVENLNEMRESRRRWREQNAAPPAIRVQLRPAFDVPAAMTAQTDVRVQARLVKQMDVIGVDSPQIQMVGRTAVIRGTVANERDRELIARMASLEPGVSAVENLVEIQGPPPAP